MRKRNNPAIHKKPRNRTMYLFLIPFALFSLLSFSMYDKADCSEKKIFHLGIKCFKNEATRFNTCINVQNTYNSVMDEAAKYPKDIKLPAQGATAQDMVKHQYILVSIRAKTKLNLGNPILNTASISLGKLLKVSSKCPENEDLLKKAKEYVDSKKIEADLALKKIEVEIPRVEGSKDALNSVSKDADFFDKTMKGMQLGIMGLTLTKMLQSPEGATHQRQANQRTSKLGNQKEDGGSAYYSGGDEGTGSALTRREEEEKEDKKLSHRNPFQRQFFEAQSAGPAGASSSGGGLGASSSGDGDSSGSLASAEKETTKKKNKSKSGKPSGGGLLGLSGGGEIEAMLGEAKPGSISLGKKEKLIGGKSMSKSGRSIASTRQSSELFKMVRTKIRSFQKKGGIW